jgi:hypothetical protein
MKDNRDPAVGWLANSENDLSAADWMLGGEGRHSHWWKGYNIISYVKTAKNSQENPCGFPKHHL